MSSQRSIAVIIPTWKPDRKLRTLLMRLRRQTIVPDDILLINTDEEAFDQTLISGISGVRVVHIPKEDFDHGGTRNMGASLTDSEIMVFMTMDAVPAHRRMLENLIAAFADPRVACAYARQLPGSASDPIERCSRAFNYGAEDQIKTKADIDRLGIKTFFCSNVCAAYRRDLFTELGGFPDKTIFNEDMIFAAGAVQAGYAVAYQAQARVLHAHSFNGMAQLRRNFDLGVSHAQFSDIFGSVKSESEGVKLVAAQARTLLRRGEWLQLPRLIWISGCKYAGYQLGKHYERLPVQLVRRLSANPAYWND